MQISNINKVSFDYSGSPNASKDPENFSNQFKNQINSPLEINIDSMTPMIQKKERLTQVNPDIHISQEEENFRANLYDSRFNILIFLEYLFYHIIYFTIGPTIIVLVPIIGYTVLYNQRFVGLSFPVFVQFFTYLPFIVFMTLFYFLDNPGIYMAEVYMGLTVTAIRIITIATKYAHTNDNFLALMKKRKLSAVEFNYQLILYYWTHQGDDIIQDELRTTILALEVDISLFHFEFMGDIPKGHEIKMLKHFSFEKSQESSREVLLLNPQRVSVIAKAIELVEEKQETKNNSLQDDSQKSKKRGDTAEPISTKNPLASLTREIIKNRFQDKFLKKKTKFDENKLYGYNYAFHLLQNARDSKQRPLGKIVFIISLVHALLPFFYRAFDGLPVLSDAPYISMPLFICNIIFFHFNTRILINTIRDLEMRIFLLKEVGDLISPKRMSHYYKKQKEHAALNFCDPITLKTWSNLRKILLHYGDKYVHRNGFNISITMVLYCCVLLVLLLQIFGIAPPFKDSGVYILVFTYESFVYFGILVLLIYFGVFL